MAPGKPIFTQETFRFFRDLGRNNKKVWMDSHRDRYQATVVQPFRRLLEALAPRVLELDDRFDTSCRSGANFSRINRDIRFAKDKTLYKPQMYVKFRQPLPGDRETGQLYAGLSKDVITAGFRVYAGPKRRESTLAMIAEPRILAKPRWVAGQKRRLGRKYDSYWYTTEKGNWIKHDGWPVRTEDWKKIQGWIVRKKMKPGAATKAGFPGELCKIFREVYPLLKFTTIP